MDIPETGPMRLPYHEHAAALWRDAYRLTGDQSRDMVGDRRHNGGFVSSDGSGALQPAGHNKRNPALDRMLVSDAIAQLPSEHRAVVRRSYYQGWTTGQIAADLGIAEEEVKLRLHHALWALRRKLSDMGVAQ